MAKSLVSCFSDSRCITNCISTFASNISILSVRFRDSEFYFLNSLAFLKFVKNSRILRIFKIHKNFQSTAAVVLGAAYCCGCSVVGVSACLNVYDGMPFCRSRPRAAQKLMNRSRSHLLACNFAKYSPM